MQRCLDAALPVPFVLAHGMSDNPGMRWDLNSRRDQLAYRPADGLPPG